MHEIRRVTVDGREYLTNGCTCAPNGNWREACDKHDVRYSIGGGFTARFRADVLLWWDIWMIGARTSPIQAVSHFIVGGVYFAAVRVMGWRFWCYWWGCDSHLQNPDVKPIRIQ